MSRILANAPTDALLEFPAEADLMGHIPEPPISLDRAAVSPLAFSRDTADDERRPVADARAQHEMRLRLNAGYELFIQSLEGRDA
jgi:hypothetical protein